MKNIRLLLAYEGTCYLGWQKTGMGPSIEETLEKALSQILQHKVKLQAASRTDAGVHAEGQVVNFFTPKETSLKSLNSLLPSDISILRVEETSETFHPTLDARGKEYVYSVCLGSAQLPFFRNFSWHFGFTLDLEKMKKAAQDLVGEHDFSAFTNERQENNIRILHGIQFDSSPNQLKIRVSGNNFLYKMVRNIVGTLLYIGCGKIEGDAVPDILKSKNRSRAGVTAPAHGLVLKKVFYD
jgi:tRNA pseudouridine38-40 synthase